jgi:hypothetical protein
MGEWGKLNTSEYYLNKETGDLLVINWKENRPNEKDWVKISKQCFNVLAYDIVKV